jgi:hypothetical protein
MTLSTFIPIVAAVFGACVGAFLAYQLPRARPRVLITSIDFSTEFSSEESVAEKNADLVSRIHASIFDLGRLYSQRAIAETVYVKFLKGAQERLADVIKLNLSLLEERAGRLRSLLYEEDYETFDREYQDFHDALYPLVETHHVTTRQPVFGNEAPSASVPTPGRSMAQGKGGDFLVHVGGNRSLAFTWRHRSEPVRADARRLAHRYASAYMHLNKPDLVALLDYARKAAPGLLQEAQDLLRDIESELSRFQRLLVSGIAVNAGRMPYAIGNRAKLVVKLKGYPETNRQNSDKSTSVRFDVDIDLTVVTDDEISMMREVMAQHQHDPAKSTSKRFTRSMVVVESREVVCASDKPVSEQAQAAELLRAYQGGERTAYIVVVTMRPSRKVLEPLHSSSFPFRDVQFEPPLPAKRNTFSRQS